MSSYTCGVFGSGAIIRLLCSLMSSATFGGLGYSTAVQSHELGNFVASVRTVLIAPLK